MKENIDKNLLEDYSILTLAFLSLLALRVLDRSERASTWILRHRLQNTSTLSKYHCNCSSTHAAIKTNHDSSELTWLVSAVSGTIVPRQFVVRSDVRIIRHSCHQQIRANAPDEWSCKLLSRFPDPFSPMPQKSHRGQ